MKRNDDDLIELSAVQEFLPRGVKSNRATVSKWCLAGARGCILWSQLVGGKRYTNRRAVREFLEALNEPATT